MKLAIGLLGTLFALLGCVSPEATRARGGGPGGDRGNRGEVVEMHAGSVPYYETPRLLGSHAEGAADDDRLAKRR